MRYFLQAFFIKTSYFFSSPYVSHFRRTPLNKIYNILGPCRFAYPGLSLPPAAISYPIYVTLGRTNSAKCSCPEGATMLVAPGFNPALPTWKPIAPHEH